MIGKEADEYIDKYCEKFGYPFPIFMLLGVPDEKIIQLIKDALNSGREIEFEYKEGVLY